MNGQRKQIILQRDKTWQIHKENINKTTARLNIDWQMSYQTKVYYSQIEHRQMHKWILTTDRTQVGRCIRNTTLDGTYIGRCINKPKNSASKQNLSDSQRILQANVTESKTNKELTQSKGRKIEKWTEKGKVRRTKGGGTEVTEYRK